MSHILMLCHDQNLDRRVVAQASSLISSGHRVTLLALAHGPDREESFTPEDIHLVRIGLAAIIPSNPVYRDYLDRQTRLNAILNLLCTYLLLFRRIWNFLFKLASRINFLFYRFMLLARYRNRHLSDPLPFTSAFVNEGVKHPSNVVQVHDLPTLEAGTELADKWQVPLVYDAHELYPEQRSFSAAQRKICSDMEAKLIKKAQLVFAVNESIAGEMARRYGIPKPVTLLNAVDPPNGFDPRTKYNLLREKLSLAPERRILLFQGGFAPHRNLENLIRAMRLVKSNDVDLVLMGFGPFGERLKAKAEKTGLLGKRVHFLPAVPQDELLQHSASADLGIIPYPHVDLNSYYCTPNKLFEFIQAGLPILANDSPELRRFVADQGFGLVKPLHTPSQIAAAIDDAFANPEFSKWKQNLLGHHAGFAWKVQSEIYLAAMLPQLGCGHGGDTPAEGMVA